MTQSTSQLVTQWPVSNHELIQSVDQLVSQSLILSGANESINQFFEQADNGSGPSESVDQSVKRSLVSQQVS